MGACAGKETKSYKGTSHVHLKPKDGGFSPNSPMAAGPMDAVARAQPLPTAAKAYGVKGEHPGAPKHGTFGHPKTHTSDQSGNTTHAPMRSKSVDVPMVARDLALEEANAAKATAKRGRHGSMGDGEREDGKEKGSLGGGDGGAKSRAPSSEVYIALHAYAARTPQDLTLIPGQEVRVLSKQKSQWWYVENSEGAAGYVPSAFLVPSTSIERFPWYHGCLERLRASNMLSQHALCTFLVRESESNAGEFSLSVRDSVGVKHYRIRCTAEGQYYISSHYTFPTLDSLVAAYSREAYGICCILGAPCPRAVSRTNDLDHSTTENWEVEWESVVLQRLLGSGEFGEVWYAKWKGLTPVAVKLLKPSTANREEFLKEVSVMKQLHHGSLITLYAVISTSEPLAMITEYMPKGSLLQLLRSGAALQSRLSAMAAQVADGMAYLESKNFIHRDLAARNVLVGDDYQCKVADFGLARLVKSAYENCNGVYNPHSGAVLPVRWTAPEAFLYNSYTIKGDVWSFGILLMEMVTGGTTPYSGTTNAEVVDKVIKGYRLPKPKNCSQELYDMMTECWRHEANCRPRFEQLYLRICSQQAVLFGTTTTTPAAR